MSSTSAGAGPSVDEFDDEFESTPACNVLYDFVGKFEAGFPQLRIWPIFGQVVFRQTLPNQLADFSNCSHTRMSEWTGFDLFTHQKRSADSVDFSDF